MEESNLTFHVANILSAVAILTGIFLRFKYKRFGNIPKWWEKIGWFFMTVLVLKLLGDSMSVAQGNLRVTDDFAFVVTRACLALYLSWYAITIYIARKRQPVYRTLRAKNRKLADKTK